MMGDRVQHQQQHQQQGGVGKQLVLVVALGWTVVGARGKMKPRYVVGVDVGTESLRAAVLDGRDGKVVGEAVEAHESQYPASGQVEQRPEDWWAGLGAATRAAVEKAGIEASTVAAVCVATTSCTVVACGSDGRPCRPALMWCDARAAEEAALVTATGDEALKIGNGPVSAEFMLPKALWLKRREKKTTWDKAEVVCECQDWLNFKLSGTWVGNGCNVATRWHGDGVEAARGSTNWVPKSLLEKSGLADLSEKWPKTCVAMGLKVGTLTQAAAEHLGLSNTCAVVQGGADAFVALCGLGAGADGGAALITGSSHLQLACAVRSTTEDADVHTQLKRENTTPKRVWGPYPGAPLSYAVMAEAGQSSTGSALRFAAETLFAGADSMEALDKEASKLPVGAQGVRAVPTFQGSRTPVCDPLARGHIAGLSLAHGRAHVWRALIEGIAVGTRDNLRELSRWLPVDMDRGVKVCGGATKSTLFLETHANAANAPFVVPRTAPLAPVVGAGLLAEACLRCEDRQHHGSTSVVATTAASAFEAAEAAQRDAVRAVGRDWHLKKRLRSVPVDKKAALQFTRLYPQPFPDTPQDSIVTPPQLQQDEAEEDGEEEKLALATAPLAKPAIAASLLAADPCRLEADARAAFDAGALIHVDVCDGSVVASGALSSLGPATVQALRRLLGPSAELDVHLAAADPAKHMPELALAADCVTVQVEAVLGPENEARRQELIDLVPSLPCRFGIALAPSTPVEVVQPFLDAGLDIDLVDVLAVEPGFGGQPFQPAVLRKLTQLKRRFPQIPRRMVDGGLAPGTRNARDAAKAGATVLVAGSAIFHSPRVDESDHERNRRIADAVAALHGAARGR